MGDGRELLALVNGYQVSQAIHVAVALGVPDALAGGPRASRRAGRGRRPGRARAAPARARRGGRRAAGGRPLRADGAGRGAAVRRPRLAGRLGGADRPPLLLERLVGPAAQRAHGRERVPRGARREHLGVPEHARRGAGDLRPRDDLALRSPARGGGRRPRLGALRHRGRRRRWARRAADGDPGPPSRRPRHRCSTSPRSWRPRRPTSGSRPRAATSSPACPRAATRTSSRP